MRKKSYITPDDIDADGYQTSGMRRKVQADTESYILPTTRSETRGNRAKHPTGLLR